MNTLNRNMTHNKYTLYFSLLIGVIAYLIVNNISTIYKLLIKTDLKSDLLKKNIYTTDTLAKFNGVDSKELYLALLGKVFDVSKGKKHYEKGSGYYYFIGKDGSRAFITGNFSDESEQKDHVIDLPCNDLFSLKNWMDTYKTRYVYKGKLIGRYFNTNGEATPYKKQLNDKLKQCNLEKKTQEEFKIKYPPCNMEWSAETGSRVWCSQNSGGVVRDWSGVPRKFFSPGTSEPQCVCVNLIKPFPAAQFKEYENCLPNSASCKT